MYNALPLMMIVHPARPARGRVTSFTHAGRPEPRLASRRSRNSSCMIGTLFVSLPTVVSVLKSPLICDISRYIDNVMESRYDCGMIKFTREGGDFYVHGLRTYPKMEQGLIATLPTQYAYTTEWS